MKLFAAIAALIFLSACSRDHSAIELDFQIVCHSTTGKSYFVRPGVGDISFVYRTPGGDEMCQPLRKQ